MVKVELPLVTTETIGMVVYGVAPAAEEKMVEIATLVMMVAEPEAMLVVPETVEMATGPPAPPAPVAVDPDPDPDPVAPVPVGAEPVTVAVVVPVWEVTVTIPLAPEPETAASMRKSV